MSLNPTPKEQPFPPESQPQPQTVVAQVAYPQAKPIVTYIIMGFTILVFLLQYASQLVYGDDLIANLGMKANDEIIQGQLWRLFTPMFLHGSILHIGFNMYALYLFGPSLEGRFGHGRFLTLYLLGGFAGNVMSFIFSAAYSLGSSTAIFGLLGAEMVFSYQNQKLLGNRARRILINVMIVAGINLIIGLSPGIDNWGHVGGLLGGTLFAWFAGPLLKLEGTFPNLTVVDQRDSRQVLLTALGVGAIFSLLTGLGIFLKLRG
ncbi:MAG: rhomboid family intramembrane serine protease [Anaerolineales bacterium]